MAFNGRFVLQVIHFCAERGAKAATLIELSGASADTLARADCRIRDEAYNAVFRTALAQTKDPCLGLHLGESQNLSAMGLVGQITQTSKTVRQALEYCCHFANLGCSKLPMMLVREHDHYVLGIEPEPLWAMQAPEVMRHTTEGSIAFAIREFLSLTHEKHRPLGVQLPWKRPPQATEHERVYGCPVTYGKARIAVLLHRRQVEAPVLTADYGLLRILVAHAEKKASLLRNKDGFHTQVKQTMVQLLNPQLPTLATVAAQFNCSTRTLQRRLATQDYTYQKLTDELRQELAHTYLQRPDLSLGDIAYLLHYSDQSAFSRAFKRWKGKAPQEFRASL